MQRIGTRREDIAGLYDSEGTQCPLFFIPDAPSFSSQTFCASWGLVSWHPSALTTSLEAQLYSSTWCGPTLTCPTLPYATLTCPALP